MNMIKTVAVETKLNLAVEALKNPAMTAKELAKKFDVSESTAKRARKEYMEEAGKKIAEMLKAEEQAKKATKGKRTQATDNPTTGPRGFRPRNGRWVILNQMFAEMGFDKPSKELWDEANKRSKAAGLKELNRGSFYAMLSIAKKGAAEAEDKVS